MGTAENRDKSKMVMCDNLNLQAVPITKTRNRKEKPDVFEEHREFQLEVSSMQSEMSKWG